MYTTCGFCAGELGGDGASSGLGVGRRFAYDGWRSRAWVICQRCGRWNLTPFDSREDAIAKLEAMAAAGRVAATSAHVALVRSGSYDVVRVGRPLRPEYATWRYGERIKARERERLKFIIPATAVAIGGMVAFNFAVGGSMAYMVGQIPGMADSLYTRMVGNRKVPNIEPPVCAHCGTIMILRAKHLQHARLTHTAHEDMALLLSCPKCQSYGAQLEGADAEQALRAGLTFVNLKKGKRIKRKAEEAAGYVDRHGGPSRFIQVTTRFEKPVSALVGTEALALEMAVDEQSELRELERQWRQAEEIANIADGLLVDPKIEKRLEDVRQRARNVTSPQPSPEADQPNG
jgi:hypothetical protein